MTSAPRPTRATPTGHGAVPARAHRSGPRARMTGKQRREQLLDVGRKLFAEKGFEGTTVEEIAANAQVSKPVVYEHFGGKEGLYAVVVDHEIETLLTAITASLSAGMPPRVLLENAALALLDYIETSTDGFRILVRDSPVAQSTGTFAYGYTVGLGIDWALLPNVFVRAEWEYVQFFPVSDFKIHVSTARVGAGIRF